MVPFPCKSWLMLASLPPCQRGHAVCGIKVSIAVTISSNCPCSVASRVELTIEPQALRFFQLRYSVKSQFDGWLAQRRGVSRQRPSRQRRIVYK